MPKDCETCDLVQNLADQQHNVTTALREMNLLARRVVFDEEAIESANKLWEMLTTLRADHWDDAHDDVLKPSVA